MFDPALCFYCQDPENPPPLNQQGALVANICLRCNDLEIELRQRLQRAPQLAGRTLTDLEFRILTFLARRGLVKMHRLSLLGADGGYSRSTTVFEGLVDYEADEALHPFRGQTLFCEACGEGAEWHPGAL